MNHTAVSVYMYLVLSRSEEITGPSTSKVLNQSNSIMVLCVALPNNIHCALNKGAMDYRWKTPIYIANLWFSATLETHLSNSDLSTSGLIKRENSI